MWRSSIGVCGNIALLKLLKKLALQHNIESLQHTGFYGEPLS
jgi:hypothetical protein